jgi:hypothetical protein
MLRIALSLALLAPAADVPVEDEAAITLFWQGVEQYEAGNYAAAAAAFEAAHAIEAAPELLFSIGNMRRLAGQCEAAVEALEDFLATDPPPVSANDARAAIAECSDEVPPPIVEPPIEAAPDEAIPDAPRRPWQRDPTAGALLGVGAAGIVVGLGFGVAARVHDRDAGNAQRHDDFLDLRAATRTESTVAAIALSVGAALVVGAAIRYAIMRRRAQ